MPRYYFSTRIDDELVLDPEGEELRDPDHAWEIARITIRQILQDEGTAPNLLRAVLEVSDESGEIVLEFPFSEALIDFPGTPRTTH